MSAGREIIAGMREALQRKPNWTSEEVMEELLEVQADYIERLEEPPEFIESKSRKSYRCDCPEPIPAGEENWCQNCGGGI